MTGRDLFCNATETEGGKAVVAADNDLKRKLLEAGSAVTVPLTLEQAVEASDNDLKQKLLEAGVSAAVTGLSTGR